MDAKEKFNRNYIEIKETGCWYWLGALRGGYGVMRLGKRIHNAHRAAWMIFRGEIPEGLHVLHICDFRQCVNPQHLFLGTPLDNMLDAKKKGRLKGWRRDKGKKICRKISYDQALRIKALLKDGISHEKISVLFGVTRDCIGAIARGKTHKHV